MSKTALLAAIKRFDVTEIAATLEGQPELRDFRSERGLDLLQIVSSRATEDDPETAPRQVRVARWLVERGFDPKTLHTTAPGEDGEAEPTAVSLVWFAVAKAQNTQLARFFLKEGASPKALFAAAWWGNASIVADLVDYGADVNERVGGTPLHLAVDVARRGTDGRPERAKMRLRFLRELLKRGADPNLPGDDGTTPLHTALKKDYADVFALLMQYGADPDVPGGDGRTVREIANRKRDRQYAAILNRSKR